MFQKIDSLGRFESTDVEIKLYRFRGRGFHCLDQLVVFPKITGLSRHFSDSSRISPRRPKGSVSTQRRAENTTLLARLLDIVMRAQIRDNLLDDELQILVRFAVLLFSVFRVHEHDNGTADLPIGDKNIDNIRHSCLLLVIRSIQNNQKRMGSVLAPVSRRHIDSDPPCAVENRALKIHHLNRSSWNGVVGLQFFGLDVRRHRQYRILTDRSGTGSRIPGIEEPLTVDNDFVIEAGIAGKFFDQIIVVCSFDRAHPVCIRLPSVPVSCDADPQIGIPPVEKETSVSRADRESMRFKESIQHGLAFSRRLIESGLESFPERFLGGFDGQIRASGK